MGDPTEWRKECKSGRGLVQEEPGIGFPVLETFLTLLSRSSVYSRASVTSGRAGHSCFPTQPPASVDEHNSPEPAGNLTGMEQMPQPEAWCEPWRWGGASGLSPEQNGCPSGWQETVTDKGDLGGVKPRLLQDPPSSGVLGVGKPGPQWGFRRDTHCPHTVFSCAPKQPYLKSFGVTGEESNVLFSVFFFFFNVCLFCLLQK